MLYVELSNPNNVNLRMPKIKEGQYVAHGHIFDEYYWVQL